MATRRILFSLFLLVGVCCAQEYGSISGTVTGEDGKPVSSAAVYAFRLIETKAIWIGAIPERETDADGHYSFERLEYGSYTSSRQRPMPVTPMDRMVSSSLLTSRLRQFSRRPTQTEPLI